MEQDEQPGENYCGIEDGVRTAGTETLSAGVLELWTGVLSAARYEGRGDRSCSTLFGLEKCPLKTGRHLSKFFSRFASSFSTKKQTNCRPTSVAVPWLSRSVAGGHGRSLLSPRSHPDKSMCVLWKTNCHRGSCVTRFCGLCMSVSFHLN